MFYIYKFMKTSFGLYLVKAFVNGEFINNAIQ